MKYKAVVSYDGTNFYGFQRLNSKRSVQKVLEEALSILNKQKVTVKGASRTDKGVHALHQVISFSMDVNIPILRFKKAINRILPADIRIIDIENVADTFHARFNVVSKTYVYKINLGSYDVFKSNYYLQYDYKLDIEKIKECAKLFLGFHNFKNFVSGYRKNYNLTIDKIDFKYSNDILEIKFVGKSFYKYMIRNIVGALLFVGSNRRSIADIKVMLSEPEKNISLYTAPACGLYLVDIKYKNI